ncbi:hypothetical protein ACLM5H_23690 [Fredinandcohnia humi]
MTTKTKGEIKVTPVLIWEQKNNKEHASTVIPLFRNHTNQSEEVIEQVNVQTENQEIKITKVSSGFGKITMQQGPVSRLVA